MGLNNKGWIAGTFVVIVVVFLIWLIWSKKEKMIDMWFTTPQYVGSMEFAPNVETFQSQTEGFDPRGQMLKQMPDEDFGVGELPLHNVNDITNVTSTASFKAYPHGYTPQRLYKPYPKYKKVVPYNTDVSAFLHNKDFTEGPRQMRRIAEDKEKGLGKEPFQVGFEEGYLPGTFQPMPPEYNDRSIRGCPIVFPITQGAYDKFYVMAGDTKDGGLVYEYYGRNRADARLKYKNAYPGCEYPSDIKQVANVKKEA